MLDLQAHMVDEHGAEMSSRQQKDARRVNAGFEFQEINAQGSGGRRRPPREREPPPGSQQPGPGPGRPGGAGGGNSRRERFGGQLTVDGDTSANASAGPSRRQTPSPPPADMDPVTAEYV